MAPSAVVSAPPPVDLAAERRNGDFVRGLIARRDINAAHDLSDGGLAIACDGPEDCGGRPCCASFAVQGTTPQVGNVSCSAAPSDCGEISQLNQLDGFNPNARMTVRFSGAVNPETLRNGLLYVWLDPVAGRYNLGTAGQVTGINQPIWDAATNTAFAKPDQILEGGRRYLIVVTDAVRDTAGEEPDRLAVRDHVVRARGPVVAREVHEVRIGDGRVALERRAHREHVARRRRDRAERTSQDGGRWPERRGMGAAAVRADDRRLVLGARDDFLESGSGGAAAD